MPKAHTTARRLAVRIRSKTIGQTWHYEATRVLETEPMAEAPSARANKRDDLVALLKSAGARETP